MPRGPCGGFFVVPASPPLCKGRWPGQRPGRRDCLAKSSGSNVALRCHSRSLSCAAIPQSAAPPAPFTQGGRGVGGTRNAIFLEAPFPTAFLSRGQRSRRKKPEIDLNCGKGSPSPFPSFPQNKTPSLQKDSPKTVDKDWILRYTSKVGVCIWPWAAACATRRVTTE